MRFAVDSMLGRLARWLRLSGYDVVYYRGLQDDEILEHAFKERRLLLSRDSALCRQAGKAGIKYLYVRGGDFIDQMRQVMTELNIKFYDTPIYSRCPKCNGEIIRAGEESIGRVPEMVRSRISEFWECSECGQVYWEGSHWKNIRKVIRRVKDVQDSGEG